MRARPDILSSDSPKGLEVYQLTGEEGVDSCHIYMESQIFTPDSRRLVVHRHAHPHGGDIDNPLHQYLLCDLADEGRLLPLTEEEGVTGPAISPDGKYFYYFAVSGIHPPFRVALKRLLLETWERETLAVVDGHLPGTGIPIGRRGYGLASIRSDGNAVVVPVFLGHGQPNPDWGLLKFHLGTGEVSLVLRGPSWCNIHPQYCRSDDPEALYDILVQENHGCVVSPDGSVQRLTREPGCDIHVIRDDGTNLRALPWGRDGVEACRGHQCWRGNTPYAIGSVDVLSGQGQGDIHLIEGEALAYPDHLGRGLPGGRFNDLTRDLADPRCDHFATDRTGDALIFDGLHEDGWKIRLAQLGKAGQDSIRTVTPLLDTKSRVGATPEKLCHPHPFFSPDGTMAFFNSNESGDLQAYMLRNFSI